MSKFTKAPWRVAENRFGVDALVRSADNDPVAAILFAGYQEQESRANAHLIAAAPDMYEALENLEKFLVDIDKLKLIEDYNYKIGKNWLIVKHALRKARGEE